MLSVSTSKSIDDPCTNMEPVRVGVVPPGRGTPDLFVTVDRDGQPFLRIDVYAEYLTGPYCHAILWKTFAVIGWNDVDRMTTIDFAQVLAAPGVKWAEGEPVLISEADGAALFKVSEAGLAYALEHVGAFPPECEADLRKLAAFVKEHGASSIYEYATF